jgi:hypothetical protein
MAPTCTRNNKTKRKTRKKGDSKFPFYQDLAMAPICTQKKKNQKKEEEGELKLPFYQDLAMVPHKQQKN